MKTSVFFLLFWVSDIEMFPESFQLWTQQLSLPTGMEVKWNSEDQHYLTFEMSAPTQGYVAVGFSPNGGMKGSDIVLGWVDNDGTPYVVDFYAPEREQPVQDDQQDYDLIAASERDGRTTVRFRRRWDTCDDQQDLKVTDDTARLIWAWHPSDPMTIPSLSFSWHGIMSRGSQTILLRPTQRSFTFPDQIRTAGEGRNEHWDAIMSRIHIAYKESTLMCRILKFPRPDTKFHLIGFRPLILKAENVEFVRHISLYKCYAPDHYGGTRFVFDKYAGTEGSECFGPQTPSEWKTFCWEFLLTWVPGLEGDMFPPHIGIPIGESDDSVYFKLEIHYENPLRNTFLDNSGLRLFYTSYLRPNDAGTLILGHRITPFQIIPPYQESFTTQSFCSKECTKNGILSPSGINITSGLLHAHEAGRKIMLRHVRHGQELQPILQDNHFDSTFQQFRRVKEEVVVLPGDELIVECTYDTERKNGITFGGLSPEEEMCQATVLYYPKTDLTNCRSQPEFDSFFSALGIFNVSGTIFDKMNLPLTKFWPHLNSGSINLVPVDNTLQLLGAVEHNFPNPFETARFTTPSKSSASIGPYMRQINWHQREMSDGIETTLRNGLHYMFCSTSDLRRIPIEETTLRFPKFEPYRYIHPSDCRDAESQKSSTKSTIPSLFLASICFLML